MESKIEKLSVKEILDKVGFPINVYEFRNTYKIGVDLEKAITFEKKILSQTQPGEIINIICENQDIFDKELYVLHLGRLLDKDIDAIKRSILLDSDAPKQQVFTNDVTGKNKRRFLVTAKELLRDIDIVDIEIHPTTKEILVFTSKEFSGNSAIINKRRIAAQEKIKQIDEKLRLSKVIEYIKPADFVDFCKYPNLGNLLSAVSYGEENKKATEEVKVEDFEQMIRKYAEYIDIDKMLVLANAYYYYSVSENDLKESYEQIIELKKFTDNVAEFITKRGITVDSKKLEKIISFKEIQEEIEEKSCSFINGVYYTKEERNELIENIIAGEERINFILPESFNLSIHFTIKQYETLIKNSPNSLKYLVENDIINSEQITEIFKRIKTIEDTQLLYLMHSKKITIEHVLELYFSNIISLKNINYIKMNLNKKYWKNLVSTEVLINLYFNSEDKDKFNKYRKLYKIIIIDETKEELELKEKYQNDIDELEEIEENIKDRRLEIDEQILEITDKALNDKFLYEFYKFGLITIDTFTNYVEDESIESLYTSFKINPIDARKMVEEKSISEKTLEDVFSNDKLSEWERMVLIYSTFCSDSVKDKNSRNKFIKLVKKNNSDDNDEKTHPIIEELLTYDNKMASDPCANWLFISSLDKQYSQKVLQDGFVVFYLPNKECFVLEKIYDKNNEQVYGYATYIVSESLFESQIDEIIIDGILNQRYLLKSKKRQNKEVTKIINAGWGNAISKFFDINNSERYTKEEKENIKKMAERVENSKEALGKKVV